jgi:hypothetical protein
MRGRVIQSSGPLRCGIIEGMDMRGSRDLLWWTEALKAARTIAS